jgi:hypothetical protein
MLTVAEVESVLDARCHGLLVALGLPTITDGTNPFMKDPIAWGMSRIGIYPASGVWITDPDLAPYTLQSAGKGIDYAEYRMLENMMCSDVMVDTRVGNGSLMLSQILKAIEARLNRLSKPLGISLQPLRGGSIIKRLGPGDPADEFTPDNVPEGSP